MINAVTETIKGVKITKRVAIFTLAAKATGNIPNPAFDGASKLVLSEMKYKAINTTETPKEMRDRGNNNSFFFSSFNSL